MATLRTSRPIDLAQLAAEVGVPVACTSSLRDPEAPGDKVLAVDIPQATLEAAVNAHVPGGRAARRRAAIRDAIRLIAARADTPESWAALSPAERTEVQRLAVRALVAALVDLFTDA